MPTRDAYERVVRQVLEPDLADTQTAWRGFYRLLLWFEKGVPHIIDGDKLAAGAWRSRAVAVGHVVAEELGCPQSSLPNRVDQLVKSPLFGRPPQRHNPLGIGFVTGLFVALGHFSSSEFTFYPEEAIGEAVFRGIREAPRSRPDIVVVKGGSEIAVISAKWSIRHDRLKDVKDEAGYFKTLMGRLKFYVVTNEFDPARLNKLLEDFRIDSVFHVNRRLVVDVAGLNGRLEQMQDLSELLSLYAANP